MSNRVNTRIKNEVMEGDVVVRNSRGWWEVGTVSRYGGPKIWQKGKLRDLTVDELTEAGLGVRPISKESARALGMTTKQAVPDFFPALAGLAVAGLIVAVVALLMKSRGL